MSLLVKLKNIKKKKRKLTAFPAKFCLVVSAVQLKTIIVYEILRKRYDAFCETQNYVRTTIIYDVLMNLSYALLRKQRTKNLIFCTNFFDEQFNILYELF